METASGRDSLPAADVHGARIRVEYNRPGLDPSPQLAAVRFAVDGTPAAHDAALHINVQLQPLNHPDWIELWPAAGIVRSGSEGAVRFASDDHHLIAVIDCDEHAHRNLRAASEAVYRELRRFQRRSEFPHMLRIWNYFDAINAGDGDAERYRQFCLGRTEGLGGTAQEQYPAASAIGCKSRTQQLQVYWLAARHPGTCVENPRQVSAYRYPRSYGPTPPTFARAMIVEDGTLLISGTASIVGHASQHHGDPLAQLDETILNLRTLADQARQGYAACFRNTLLKIYLRDASHLPQIEARIRHVWPESQMLFLAADICRSELLLEIEGVMSN